jgi:hypothetical protein
VPNQPKEGVSTATQPESPETILQGADERMRAGLYSPEARSLFTWHVGRHCGFRCPYCAVNWDFLETLPLPLGRAIMAWYRWHEERGPAQICCSGAEPMYEEDVVRVLGTIGQWHVLDITSNMAFKREWLDYFPDPGRVFFSASYHPQPRAGGSQPLSAFLHRVTRVRDRGFHVTGASCVAYPPLIAGLADAKRQIEEHDLYFSLHLFRGVLEGREYPKAYTLKERGALADLLGGPEKLNEVEPREMLGRPCWTGARYLTILATGEAYRCPGAVGDQSMGNLYRGTLAASEGPTPCGSVDGCACRELWPYHASEAEAKAADWARQ